MKHRQLRAEDETATLPEYGEQYERYRRTIRFDVSDRPIPQGSTKAFIINNKPVITSTSRNLNQWRQLIKNKAQGLVEAPLEGPVAVTLRFRLKKPKSAPKRLYPDKRPDLDKLIRAVLDAITHIIIADDSQVVTLTATKEYGSPGVLIEVDEIGT